MGMREGIPDVNPRRDQKAGQNEGKISIIKQPSQTLPGSMTTDRVWCDVDYPVKRWGKYIYILS